MKPSNFICVVKRAAMAWVDNDASSYGAAIAYYTVFSLSPLLLIAINLARLVVGDEAARQGIATELQNTLGASTADSVLAVFEYSGQAGGNAGLTIVGLAVLLLGASGVFVELQTALNLIWKTAAPPRQDNAVIHFLKNRALSFLAVLITGLLLLISLVANSVLAALSHWMVSFPGSALMWQGLGMLVSFASITLLFALIFNLVPDLHIAWRDVWVGALLTALLFTLGQALIGLYLSQVSPASAFGAAGSLVVLLVWVYYSAQVVLFGAEITHAYAEVHGSVGALGTR